MAFRALWKSGSGSSPISLQLGQLLKCRPSVHREAVLSNGLPPLHGLFGSLLPVRQHDGKSHKRYTELRTESGLPTCGYQHHEMTSRIRRSGACPSRFIHRREVLTIHTDGFVAQEVLQCDKLPWHQTKWLPLILDAGHFCQYQVRSITEWCWCSLGTSSCACCGPRLGISYKGVHGEAAPACWSQ